MRSLVGMVSNLVAMQEKKDMDVQFDASLAKNRLRKFFPLREMGENVDYLLAQPEIRKAIVELLHAHFTKQLGRRWTKSAIDTEFIAFFFSKKLATHVYWHESRDKA